MDPCRWNPAAICEHGAAAAERRASTSRPPAARAVDGDGFVLSYGKLLADGTYCASLAVKMEARSLHGFMGEVNVALEAGALARFEIVLRHMGGGTGACTPFARWMEALPVPTMAWAMGCALSAGMVVLMGAEHRYCAAGTEIGNFGAVENFCYRGRRVFLKTPGKRGAAATPACLDLPLPENPRAALLGAHKEELGWIAARTGRPLPRITRRWGWAQIRSVRDALVDGVVHEICSLEDARMRAWGMR